jgi:hypothetical protein
VKSVRENFKEGGSEAGGGAGGGGKVPKRKTALVIAPVGGHLRRSPAVRQAPYCVGFSCFCSLKQLPNSLKSQ